MSKKKPKSNQEQTADVREATLSKADAGTADDNAAETNEKTALQEDMPPAEAAISENGENIENGEAPEETLPPLIRLKNTVAAALPPFLERCGFPHMLLARFIGVYMILSACNIFISQKNSIKPVDMWKEFIGEADIAVNIFWIAFGFFLLTFYHFFVDKKYRVADQIFLIIGTLMFSAVLMWRNSNFYLCIGVAAIAIVFVTYAVGKIRRCQFEALPDHFAGLIVFAVAAGVTAFIAVTSVAQHAIFGTSCYDFGIFVQMFHSMVTDLTAVTTCERDTFLSHFNVHTSFIYYLLAPVYAIFPHENTLLISQAVLAMGGVIPLFLIARKHNYKGFSLVSVCMVYVFCTGILAPCYYDFHENAFLPTLLMWTLYAMDQRKYILFYIMSVLVCIVKEDAPLYIICIAAYFFFQEKSWKRWHGALIAALAAIYFVLAMKWLTEYGDGQMMTSSRFGNLTINPDDGFVGIIQNVLLNPAYFFSLFVRENTLLFLLQVMLPLLFMPFVTKKISRFLLMIPFIIMNLVVGAGYGYAANIGFQYIFGPSVLLIYMMLINCDDVRPSKKNMLVTASAAVAFVCAICLVSGNISDYENYKKREEHYEAMELCLDSIPEDASVACNTWYLPHIADREEIYVLDNGDFNVDPNDETIKTLKEINRYDFFVMSVYDDYTEQASAQLEAAGFRLYNKLDGTMVIYVSPHYQTAQ